MATIIQDLRYGLRQLGHNPGFTAVAVIALALGIGANTAIFTVVNTVLLNPLRFPRPNQLVSVRQDYKFGPGSVSYPNFFDWRAQNHVFSHIAAYRGNDFTLTGTGESIHLPGELVTWDFFQLLDARPLLGRGFLPKEEKAGSHVVVLSHSLWQSRFKSDPGIVGRVVTLDGKSYTVVGVMPAGFQFPISAEPPELWTTIATDAEGKTPLTAQRSAVLLRLIARLKPHVSLVRAEADMNLIDQRLAKQYPNEDGDFKGIAIGSELQDLVQNVRLGLLILSGAVGCVLLIACANVANLLLGRATTRNREMAIRAALGAGRRRVIRQLLTESMLLSLFGAGLGLLLAAWGTAFLLRFVPVSIPRAQQIGMNGHVLLFAIVLAFLTAVVFGVVPAVQVSKPNLVESLKEGRRGASDASRHHRLRAALVIGETAVALILLASAGLLIASYLALQRVDPGFNPRNVLTFTFRLPDARYSDAQKLAFYNEFLGRLQSSPGVRSASAVVPLPDSGNLWSVSFQIEGRPAPPGQEPEAGFAMADPGYFHTLGIPILRGREFSETDNAKSLPVVIVSQAFAQRYFPNQDPVGKRIQPGASMSGAALWREIIGVVGNVKNRGLAGEMPPIYYVPYQQLPLSSLTFVVRAESNPRALVGTVRRLMASMDRNTPVYNVEMMNEYLSASVAQPRFNTLMLGIFAGLALILAAVGLYGVISYSVAQRTHEFGIRMALGAQRETILKLVLREGLMLALAGVGIGLAGALGLTRFISSLLYGVKSSNPLVLAGVAVILIGVALLASYIPARRATRVDPMEALRYE
jgi:putative ABC transport system permease protein